MQTVEGEKVLFSFFSGLEPRVGRGKPRAVSVHPQNLRMKPILSVAELKDGKSLIPGDIMRAPESHCP